MPLTITSFEYRKRRAGDQIDVTFDDGSTLGLDAELAARFQLKRAMVLPDQTLELLKHEQAKLSARRRLIGFVALRKKTEREVEQYLKRLGFDEQAIDYAVSSARELGYLDDARYADAYTRTQEKAGDKGPRAIKYELLAKGIDSDLAEQSVQSLEDPELQRERAREAGQKKVASLRREEPRKARQKLQQYLLRKGYDSDIAAEVTRQLLGEEME